MAEDKDHRAFCLRQLKRLDVFKDFRFTGEAGLQEFTDWIVSRSRGDEESVKSLIAAVIDRCSESGTCPDMRDLVAVWRDQHPRQEKPSASRDCEYCEGTGWEMVSDRNGNTGARPCRCKGFPPAHTLEKYDSLPPEGTHARSFLSRIAAKIGGAL